MHFYATLWNAMAKKKKENLISSVVLLIADAVLKLIRTL